MAAVSSSNSNASWKLVYEASDGGVNAFSAPACERAPLARRPLGRQRVV
jgi:hypothetical protein